MSTHTIAVQHARSYRPRCDELNALQLVAANAGPLCSRGVAQTVPQPRAAVYADLVDVACATANA